MYVCLCNGVSDKKFAVQSVSFIRNLSNNCVSLFLWEINVVSAFAPRAEVMQDELMQMPEFKEIA